MINSYRYSAPVILPDLSGLNITRLFSLVKTQQATTNLCIAIVNSAASASFRYVFFDALGQISSSSPLSTTTTDNEGTTLQDFFDATGSTTDMLVVRWYCQITATAVDNASLNINAPVIAESRVILTKNGMPCIKFTGGSQSYFNRRFVTTPFPALDSGNDFTLTTISALAVATEAYTLISNTRNSLLSNDSRINLNNNGTIGNKLVGFIRNLANTINILIDSDLVLTTTDQKRQSLTYDGADFKLYYNSNVQADVEPFTSDWENNDFRIGAQRNAPTVFKGSAQFIAVHDAGLTGAQVTTLDGKLNDIFSF